MTELFYLASTRQNSIIAHPTVSGFPRVLMAVYSIAAKPRLRFFD